MQKRESHRRTGNDQGPGHRRITQIHGDFFVVGRHNQILTGTVLFMLFPVPAFETAGWPRRCIPSLSCVFQNPSASHLGRIIDRRNGMPPQETALRLLKEAGWQRTPRCLSRHRQPADGTGKGNGYKNRNQN